MNFLLSCICTYLLLILPIPIAALVLQPHTNVSEDTAHVKLSGIATSDIGIGLDAKPFPGPLTAWCRAPDSELDLHYSTSSGLPLKNQDIIWIVGVLRRVTEEEAKKRGRDALVGVRSLATTIRGIVITVFDEKLMDRTWTEVYDALETVLFCIFQKKIASEFHGVMFEIATWQRLAAIMIVRAKQSRELSESNVTDS